MWLFPALARVDRLEDVRARPCARRVGAVAVSFGARWRPSASRRSSAPDAGGNRNVESPGATVREVLESLVATYPALHDRVFDDGELPQFLNVFVDGSDVRLLDGLDTTGRRRRRP